MVEVGGIGPVPFAGMMLSDLGADVVRLDRPGDDLRSTHRILLRGRRSVVVDLKSELGQEVVGRLVDRCDVLLEGFRPGVAERLGFGPDVALARNPRLVYGRMTGWGQDGPYAALAGHDITYLAVTGVLDAFVGGDGRPVPPLNLLGDFGGGGMLLALGVVAALSHAQRTGVGQVVDAAIVDGVGSMTAMHRAMLGADMWSGPPGANLFDGGAPFYRCYRTSDDRWMAVGAIEPAFYAQLVAGLGLSATDADATDADATGADATDAVAAHAEVTEVDAPRVDVREQLDRDTWPRTTQLFAERFATRTLTQWVTRFEGADACVAPVLTLAEADVDPHLRSRSESAVGSGVSAAGPQPAPAPRFSVTPGAAGEAFGLVGRHTDEVLDELGVAK